jgi:hypothetical protein
MNSLNDSWYKFNITCLYVLKTLSLIVLIVRLPLFVFVVNILNENKYKHEVLSTHRKD